MTSHGDNHGFRGGSHPRKRLSSLYLVILIVACICAGIGLACAKAYAEDSNIDSIANLANSLEQDAGDDASDATVSGIRRLAANKLLMMSTGSTTSVSNAIATENGSIIVKKVVESETSFEPEADQQFNFTIYMEKDGVEDNSDHYSVITDSNGNTVVSLNVRSGSSFTLTAGEQLTMVAVENGEQYRITEESVTGFETTSENAEGTVVGGSAANVTFTNTFLAQSVTLSGSEYLKISKRLDGTSWSGDSYNFSIKPVEKGYPKPSEETISLTSDSDDEGVVVTGAFGDITFDKPGTYAYTITEDVPTVLNSGVTYSSAIYLVTVDVTEDYSSAKLSATATMKRLQDDDGDTKNETVDDFTASFVNKFEEGKITVHQVGEKIYVDDSGATTLSNGQFEFSISADSETPDAPLPETTTVTNIGSQIFWPSITFDKIGTYKYDVQEIVPSDPDGNMTYDVDLIVATVQVDKVTGTDTFVASVTYYDETKGVNVDKPTFTNIYSPTTASASLVATKTLNGRDSQDGESFKVVAKAYDASTESAVTNGWVIAADEYKDGVLAEGTVSDLSNGVQKTFDLSEIKFTHVGTYRFSLSEVAGDAANMTYDTHVCVAVVDVAYKDGALVASVSYVGENNSFINRYSPTPVTINGGSGTESIQAVKDYTSYDYSYSDSFTFNLKATGSQTGVEGPELQSETVDMSPNTEQTITFPQSIVFSNPGTYTYEITEVIPEDATEGSYRGMQYDTHTCEVVVTVTDDASSGKLAASIDYKTSNTFTNTAAYVPATLQSLNVTKVIEGGDRGWLDDDEFTMKLTASEGAPMPENTTVVCTKDNPTQSFGSITYTTAGTYYYYVTEDNSNLPEGFEENDTTYTITVTTTPTYEELAIAVDYGNNDNTSLQVENQYKSSVLSTMPIQVSKKLVGADATEADEFQINMEYFGGTSTPSGETSQSVSFGKTDNADTNLTDGTVRTKTFGEDILFTEAGTYSFKLSESIPSGAVDNVYNDITYDDSVYYADIIVSNDFNTGTLVATVTYYDSNYNEMDEPPVFINRYKAKKVVVDDIEVNKKLTGRDWIDSDEFMFVLNDKSTGNLVSQATVIRSENPATFSAITYYEPGTYTYVMSESLSENPVTLDESTYLVIVLVSEGEDGTLTASVSYADSDGKALSEAPTFVNTYTPGTGDMYVNIQKLISGRGWRSQDMYEFKIVGATGTEPMPASQYATMDMNTEPISWFQPIFFDEIGTYTYYVSEVPGDIIGIEYSTHVCTVVITTYDDPEDGILKANISYDGDSGASWASFTNTYSPLAATTAPLSVTKVIDGRGWNDSDTFEFTCTPKDGAPSPANTTILADIDNQTVNFGDITFSEPGSYTYEVQELAGTEGGMTYASEPLYYEVMVIDPGTGELEVSSTVVRDSDGNEVDPVFTNEYAANPTTIANIQATKILEGRPWLDSDGFQIQLTDSQTGDVIDTETATKNNQTVTFKPLTFEEAGTYTYDITEVHGDLAGMTYDKSVWKAIITVKDNDEGNLVATLSYEGPDGQTTTPSFTNSYNATPVLVDDIEIEKVLIGREWRSTDEFSFYVTSDDPDAPLPETNPVVIDSETENHSIKLSGLTYSTSGTYTYQIKETVDKDAVALKYDEEPKTVTVKITPDYDNGTFKYQVLYTSLATDLGDTEVSSTTDSAVFTNIYAPTSVTADPLSVTKKLEGRDWLDTDSFTVKLEAIDGAPMPDKDTVDLTKDNQTVNFGDIKYEYPGTFEYELSEEIGDIKDITYSQSVIKATVVVVEGEKGQLSVESVTYTDENGAETDDVFVNEYTPGALALSGSEIKVSKLLTAPDGIDVAADSYSFTLTADDATELAGATTQTTTIDGVEPNVVATGSFNKNIVFKKAGTYTFSLKENAQTDSDNGITYDSSVHTITVVVTQNENTNELQAQILYDDQSPEPVPFLNKYKANPVTVSGISATKVLEGREWTDDDSFEFEITGAGKTDVLASATATKDNQTAVFGDLTFDESGTYYYAISEKAGSEEGISYDAGTWTMIVQVADEGTGTLVATVSYKSPDGEDAEAPTFTNVYTPAPVTVDNIQVQKVLEGRPWIDSDAFEFTLVDESTGREVETATATKDDQTVTFKALTFDKAGTYTYDMKEVDGGFAGVSYDTSVWKVVVTVTNDGTGSFKTSLAYVGPDEQTTIPTFTNTYTATAVSVDDIQIQKVISGRAWEPTDSFDFTLFSTDLAEPMPASSSVTIDADSQNHATDVPAITFDAAGTYTYQIREVDDGAVVAMKYDIAAKTVTITVVPDYEKGTYSYWISYSGADNALGASVAGADAAVFTNVYDPTPVTAQPLGVTKVLEGRDWYDSDSFEVKVAAVDGAPMPASDAVELTKARQTASFGDIEYTMPGTYVYELTETKGDIEDVTYDQSEIKATVVVKQDDEGRLYIDSVSYENEDGEACESVFTNEYTPGALTLSGSDIKVSKLLTAPEGVDVANDSYSFTLQADDATNLSGATKQTTTLSGVEANVVATGTFTKDIVFKKAGTYAFTMSENQPAGAAGGVAYDASARTVTVVVTQNPVTNDLQAQILYDGDSTDPKPFENTYAPAPATVSGITATKVLTGREWNDTDSFTFELAKAGTTDVVATATATASNKTTTFGDLTFDEAGTYYYTMSEKVGSEQGVTYDSDAWTVVVDVLDDGTGDLSAKVSYKAPQGSDDAEPTFTNVYTSSATVGSVATLTGLFTMDGHDASKDQFQFTLTPSDDASAALVPATTFTNRDTTIDTTTALLGEKESLSDLFSNLRLTNADAGKTYSWTLAETSEQADGYTVDTAVHTIEIKVATDAEGATLITVYVDGASVTGATSIVFTNSYYASTKEPVTIRATKVLENEALTAGEFSFVLYNQQNVAVATGTNAADGTIEFGGLEYNTTDSWADASKGLASKTTYEGKDAVKYTYGVVEDTSDLPEGMHAVRAYFNVAVYLTDDGNGTLEAHVEYPDDTTLVNAYETNAVSLDILGVKYVDTTQTNVFAPDITGKFTFTLTGSDGAPMPAATTATNDAAGSIDFGTVSYTIEDLDDQESKTFTYTVLESGTVAGIANDAETKSFSVTVTNEGDGVLDAVVSPADQPYFTFTNTYAVAPVTSSPTDELSVVKVLSGRPLEAGDFTFDLVDSDGNVAASGTNAADGTVSLSGVTFSEPGTYAYTLREEAGDMAGVTYDKTVHTVVATVTNTGEGTLDVAWSFGSTASGGVATFSNSYEANPGAASVVATKVLKNADLVDGEFAFQLIDASGVVVETVTNTASGAVVFTSLAFDEAGTYSYSIREVAGDDADITYDSKTVSVTITVTQDYADAKLVATVAYDPDNVFTNVYAAPKPANPDEGTTGGGDATGSGSGASGGDESDTPAVAGGSEQQGTETSQQSESQAAGGPSTGVAAEDAGENDATGDDTSDSVSGKPHVIPVDELPDTADTASFAQAVACLAVGAPLVAAALSHLDVKKRGLR